MRRSAWIGASLVLGSVGIGGCGGDGDGSDLGPLGSGAGLSHAVGRWEPRGGDTCTREVHDSHTTVGPDGKLYPTWHPPTDPATACSFGHEHGRDPHGSNLFDEVGAIPFGYANEQLDTYDPALQRHEDHVGHKIDWENDFELHYSGDAAGQLLQGARCDALVKLHQGSHSKDAFTNNVHELVYHIRCDDGTDMSLTLLAAIGTPGEFVSTCDRDVHITAGSPTPLGSPSGSGERVIPTRDCVEQHMLVPPGERSNFSSALRESWQISQSIRTASGRSIASVNPYFNVMRPSRFYDPAQADLTGRPIDVCYEVTGSGELAQGSDCDESTANGSLPGVSWDDPRSVFDGAQRSVDINSNRISNEDGPSVWYTDPFGKNGREEPFPGSVRQYIATVDNVLAINPSGPTFGHHREYGGPSVHAPN